MKILFFKAPSALKQRTSLKAFIVKQFEANNIRREGLNVVFCSDEELLRINRDFLQHNYFTDIITFDYGEEQVSELYISIDRVSDNARNLKVAMTEELQRVLFHGCLHIIGFGDKKVDEIQVMRKMEAKWLARFKTYVSRGTRI